MRRKGRIRRLVPLAAFALSASACVSNYDGSWLEFVLGQGVQVPQGEFLGDGQPPRNTHYEMWVVSGNTAFHLDGGDFQVVPVIDTKFPCFMEDDDARYPGLQSSQVYNRLLQDLVPDPQQTPSQAVLDILADGKARIDNQGKIEPVLKSVVLYDPTVTPDVLSALAADVPAVDAIDDASNAMRRTKCKAFYKAHPNFYVGNDKVFSLPQNGFWYGMVAGSDPRNAAPVGGAGLSVALTFKQFDEFWINWQFNDPNDPLINCANPGDCPAGHVGYGPAPTGYHYLAGKPQDRTRGVINVPMTNREFGTISAEMAIFPGIQNDDVHF
jgi:hypothetical protein